MLDYLTDTQVVALIAIHGGKADDTFKRLVCARSAHKWVEVYQPVETGAWAVLEVLKIDDPEDHMSGTKRFYTVIDSDEMRSLVSMIDGDMRSSDPEIFFGNALRWVRENENRLELYEFDGPGVTGRLVSTTLEGF